MNNPLAALSTSPTAGWARTGLPRRMMLLRGSQPLRTKKSDTPWSGRDQAVTFLVS